VEGTVFPTPGAPGPPRPFEAVVDANGRWSASVTIPARDAAGSYGVEARCTAGSPGGDCPDLARCFAYATKSLRFPSPEDSSEIPAVPVGPGSGTGVPTPATPIPGRPTYTG
jgi:hypothetical protein